MSDNRTFKFATAEEFFAWAAERIAEGRDRATFTFSEWLDMDAVIRPDGTPVMYTWVGREGKRVVKEQMPFEAPVPTYKLWETGDSWHKTSVELPREVGDVLARLWKSDAEQKQEVRMWGGYGARFYGHRNLAGVLKLLGGNADLLARAKAIRQKAEQEQARNRRNNNRDYVAHKAEELLKAIDDYGGDIGAHPNLTLRQLIALKDMKE